MPTVRASSVTMTWKTEPHHRKDRDRVDGALAKHAEDKPNDRNDGRIKKRHHAVGRKTRLQNATEQKGAKRFNREAEPERFERSPVVETVSVRGC